MVKAIMMIGGGMRIDEKDNKNIETIEDGRKFHSALLSGSRRYVPTHSECAAPVTSTQSVRQPLSSPSNRPCAGPRKT